MTGDDGRRLVVVAGSTATARIDGISAAGADPAAMVHTPAADLEILAFGRPVRAPVVPVSPTGCPTPAVVTRAVRELVGVPLTAVDAGLARPTATETVGLGTEPGRDVREPVTVPDAAHVFNVGRELGSRFPDDEILVGETIPGGTTTALGVLTALGHRASVSSSLPENPLDLKHEVVATGLASAGIDPPIADPHEAVSAVGDPVLAGVAGLVVGARRAGTAVTLAGGTQMAAATALARAAGLDDRLRLATTSFVAGDATAAIDELAVDIDLELTITDPGFDAIDHPATGAFAAGEAKEGVGMGGALALADRAGIPMSRVRDRVVELADALVAETSPPEP